MKRKTKEDRRMGVFQELKVMRLVTKKENLNHVYNECQSLSKMLTRLIQARLKSKKEQE